MAKKEKRVKHCPNPDCTRAATKYKFNADDTYCTECASELVFACASCGGPLDDQGPEHKLCAYCQAEKARHRQQVVGKAAAVAAGAAAVATKVVTTVIKK